MNALDECLFFGLVREEESVLSVLCFQGDDGAAAYKPPSIRRASTKRSSSLRFDAEENGSRFSPSADAHVKANDTITMLSAITARLAKDGLNALDLFETAVAAHTASCRSEGFLYPDELGRFLVPYLGVDCGSADLEIQGIMRFIDPDNNGYASPLIAFVDAFCGACR